MEKLLKSYQPNKRLIERYKRKIEEEESTDLPVVAGKVKGSSSEFPYTERRFSVSMEEPVLSERKKQHIRKLEAEIAKAENELSMAEQFISELPDTSAREILTYRYVDGMSVTDIGERIGYTKGRVSQIISKYLKD